jgi:hypothetical protein
MEALKDDICVDVGNTENVGVETHIHSDEAYRSDS